jgi:hypothetical protein
MSKLTSLCPLSLLLATVLFFSLCFNAQRLSAQPVDDPDVRPKITIADLQIVKRAQELLSSESKWNRADTRNCPSLAKALSLYCALQKATLEVKGKEDHRGAALQEVRFVIDEIAVDRNYQHRLMNYNNDPKTTYADIQEVLRITKSLISLRLKAGSFK